MDVDKTLQDLYAEREKLERIIAALEELQRESVPGVLSQLPARSYRTSNRGRKFMGDTERREVSERMKRYWAGRRGQQST